MFTWFCFTLYLLPDDAQKFPTDQGTLHHFIIVEMCGETCKQQQYLQSFVDTQLYICISYHNKRSKVYLQMLHLYLNNIFFKFISEAQWKTLFCICNLVNALGRML